MSRNRTLLLSLVLVAVSVSGAANAQVGDRLLAQVGSPVAAFVSGSLLLEAQDRGFRGRPGDDQSRRGRPDSPRDDASQGPRIDAGDAARRVASGREGRMLGIRPSGGDWVVRWEYPGGRVADIVVDGQSGRVSG